MKSPPYLPTEIREAWDRVPEELRKEPTCADCGMGVCRPKCAFELDPLACPRHEQKREWEEQILVALRVKT